MPTEEQSIALLHQILNRELLPVSTSWRESIGILGSEDEVIFRGLSALEESIPEDTRCALHGWIDQAVLEIVAIDRVAIIRDRARSYRPDQGGDSGVLAAINEKIIVLEFSFERGVASLSEYKKPIQPPQTTRGKAPRV
jgi:hypothetical protein